MKVLVIGGGANGGGGGVPDAQSIGLARNPVGRNINVIVASNIYARSKSNGGVGVAGEVGEQGTDTRGGVRIAVSILQHGAGTYGRVQAVFGAGEQGVRTYGMLSNPCVM